MQPAAWHASDGRLYHIWLAHSGAPRYPIRCPLSSARALCARGRSFHNLICQNLSPRIPERRHRRGRATLALEELSSIPSCSFSGRPAYPIEADWIWDIPAAACSRSHVQPSSASFVSCPPPSCRSVPWLVRNGLSIRLAIVGNRGRLG